MILGKFVVVASANGRVGIEEAARVLANGGSALDAVEVGCRLVESNPDDHSVGLGGLPNLIGEVELDASIMDGTTLRAGAVAAVKGYEHPISIARKVMELTPHVCLVGSGAERFAKEMGFEPTDLLTPESKRLWEERIRGESSDVDPGTIRYHEQIIQWLSLISDPEKPAGGTVNFLALDREGNLACGVSTSGWYCKYPGRIGDSPIIGAGNYADSRFAAVGCTGRGELAMRIPAAYTVVVRVQRGESLINALCQTMQDINKLEDPYATGLSMVALDKDGNHAAVSNRPDTTYVWLEEGMDSYRESPRIYVA